MGVKFDQAYDDYVNQMTREETAPAAMQALIGLYRAKNHDVMGRPLPPFNERAGRMPASRVDGHNMMRDEPGNYATMTEQDAINNIRNPDLQRAMAATMGNTDPATDGEIYDRQFLDRLTGRTPYRHQPFDPNNPDYSGFSNSPVDIPVEALRKLFFSGR